MTSQSWHWVLEKKGKFERMVFGDLLSLVNFSASLKFFHTLLYAHCHTKEKVWGTYGKVFLKKGKGGIQPHEISVWMREILNKME